MWSSPEKSRTRAAALNNLALARGESGDLDEATESLRAAVTILADLEVDREERRPDIWQLVEW